MWPPEVWGGLVGSTGWDFDVRFWQSTWNQHASNNDINLNAPCGAVTAAPHFWRSAFGAADCILEIANYRLKFWCLRFLFAFESCMFRQLSVCSWCLLPIRFVSGDVGNLQSLLQKCIRNASTIYNNASKFIKHLSKINQNGAKERSESDLGSKSARGC